MKALFTVVFSLVFISTAVFANEDNLIYRHAWKRGDALVEKFGQHLRAEFDLYREKVGWVENPKTYDTIWVQEIMQVRLGLAQSEFNLLAAWMLNDANSTMREAHNLRNYITKIENTHSLAMASVKLKGFFWFVLSQGYPHSSDGRETEDREIASFIARRPPLDPIFQDVVRSLLADYKASSAAYSLSFDPSPIRAIVLGEDAGISCLPAIDLSEITEENTRALTDSNRAMTDDEFEEMLNSKDL